MEVMVVRCVQNPLERGSFICYGEIVCHNCAVAFHNSTDMGNKTFSFRLDEELDNVFAPLRCM